MFDLRMPLGLFDAPTLWGTPWHGYVQGGILALPNATARPHPQPSGARHWEYTAAHLLAVPGVPPVVRSPDQAAGDAAAGREWRSYALLSGGDAQLYGKPLGAGKWIYVDPSGDRWLVDASALHHKTWSPATTPASAQVIVRRFGVLGLAADPVTYTVSVPDLGQASPPVYGATGSELGWFDSSLYSVHPQGAAATFMLHYEMAADWPSGRHPCGWYELTLAGPGSNPVIAVAVLHDRLSTLGGAEVVDSNISAPPECGLWVKFETEFVGSPSPPTCEGQVIVRDKVRLSSVPVEGYDQQWLYGGGQMRHPCGGGSRDDAESWSGMVLSVWYDETGARKTLTLDMSWSFSVTFSGSGEGATGEGVTVYNSVYTPGFACSYTEVDSDAPYSVTASMSSTAAESVAYTLKLNGAVVAEQSVSLSGTASGAITYAGSQAQGPSWSLSSNGSWSFSGGWWNGQPGANGNNSISASSMGGVGVSFLPASFGHQLRPGYAAPGQRARGLGLFSSNIYWADPHRDITLRPSRLGHAAMGWLRRVSVDGGAVAFDLVGDVVTPGGAAPAPAWTSSGGAAPSQPIFVTVQPQTGTLRYHDGPVCWV